VRNTAVVVVMLSIIPSIALKAASAVSPLLYYNYRFVFEFWGYGMKVLLRKNITFSFEDIEHKEIGVLGLPEQRGEVHKTPSEFIGLI
jgi:hypothetical protein